MISNHILGRTNAFSWLVSIIETLMDVDMYMPVRTKFYNSTAFHTEFTV